MIIQQFKPSFTRLVLCHSHFLWLLNISANCCAGHTGQSITQIGIYGKGISLLLADHTKDKTWRQVWTSINKIMPSFITYYVTKKISIVVSESSILSTSNNCSLEMQEVMLCSVAIMCRHLFRKIHLYLVSYTAMETGIKWSQDYFVQFQLCTLWIKYNIMPFTVQYIKAIHSLMFDRNF